MNVSERELRIPEFGKLGEGGITTLLRELADAVGGDLQKRFASDLARASRSGEDENEQGEFTEVVHLHSGKRLDVNMTFTWRKSRPGFFAQSLDIVNPGVEATFKLILLIFAMVGAMIAIVIAWRAGWTGSAIFLMGAVGGLMIGAIPALLMRGLIQALLVPKEAMNWCKVVAAEIEDSTEEFCSDFIEEASARILSELKAGPVKREGMRFRTNCPGCKRELMVPETIMGKKINCPQCNRPFSPRRSLS